MAARRLIAVLLLLLALSTLAAALAPQRPERESSQTRPATIPPPSATTRESPGRLVRARINAGGEESLIRLRVGDQLVLDVVSRGSDSVEIPAFGVVEAVSRDGPARFDLVAKTAGTFSVRLVGADRVVGRIVVRRS